MRQKVVDFIKHEQMGRRALANKMKDTLDHEIKDVKKRVKIQLKTWRLNKLSKKMN